MCIMQEDGDTVMTTAIFKKLEAIWNSTRTILNITDKE